MVATKKSCGFIFVSSQSCRKARWHKQSIVTSFLGLSNYYRTFIAH